MRSAVVAAFRVDVACLMGGLLHFVASSASDLSLNVDVEESRGGDDLVGDFAQHRIEVEHCVVTAVPVGSNFASLAVVTAPFGSLAIESAALASDLSPMKFWCDDLMMSTDVHVRWSFVVVEGGRLVATGLDLENYLNGERPQSTIDFDA